MNDQIERLVEYLRYFRSKYRTINDFIERNLESGKKLMQDSNGIPDIVEIPDRIFKIKIDTEYIIGIIEIKLKELGIGDVK